MRKHSLLSLAVLAFAGIVVLNLTMAGTSTQEMRFNTITKQCAQYVDCSQLYITGTAATTIKSQASLAAPLANPTFTGTVTVPTPFTIGAISMTSTGAELNILDGVTATYDEINLIDGSIAGTAVASKVLSLGANKNVDTIVIADSGLFLGAGAGTAITATAAELNTNAGVTAGTVTASKTIVVDALRDIATLGAITADGKLSVSSTIAGGASPLHLIQQINVAGDTYSGTNAIAIKNYDVDATVVHDGGENAGLAVYLKALSAPISGGEHVLATFHNHASTTAVVKHGIVVYGDLTNGISLSGGTSTNGIYMENQTNTNEIMFSNATVLITGAANTRSAVRADGGDAAATGSQYNSSAGKIYFKVANATADADWELVTTTASD